MKRVVLASAVFAIFMACNPNTNQEGVYDDGIKTVDSNGALQDTVRAAPNSSTDTAMGENRVDIQQRTDSTGNVQ